MLKPLRYFFLRIYEWKRGSESPSLALFTALASTAIAVYMHLLAIYVLLTRVVGLDIRPHDRSQARVVGITAGILIMAAFYRAWIVSNQYLGFPEEFQTETGAQRTRRTMFVVAYGVISFILPFALMILLPR